MIERTQEDLMTAQDQHSRRTMTPASNFGRYALGLALWVAAFTVSVAFGQSGEGETAPAADPSAAEMGAEPDVHMQSAFEVAPGVTVIPDPRIAFVPNVGIVEGSDAVLVVDTGLGAANGARVLALAQRIARGRQLYLTTTHFHPEHNFGASAFEGSATLILNDAQSVELREKGPEYIKLFSTFGPAVEQRLRSTTLVEPNRTYSGEMTLDLGDREVVLREIPAHTRGDQLIHVPDVSLIFTGDMAEPRFFPIMPDSDSNADRWIMELRTLEALNPEIVVPGHGSTGGTEILTAARLHIEFMRDRVRALVAAGNDQKAITELLVPAVTAIYPGWDNANFLAFEIAILYAAAKGATPELPGF
jgi:glyoxylase-like metal-dependent hydrolase (beta-lactamase superfamily II)